MPTRPPVFRPKGWREPNREAWARPPGWVDKRKRGRAGMKDRAQVLAEEPCCRLCLTQGKQVKAAEVDHIVPLARGGSDERSNKQALCKPCHATKSKAERAWRPRA